MAAAEARAVWQRAANRCFVQEDAKRAPKLACCQSSSSGSKPVDPVPTTPEDGVDPPVSGFLPFNRKPSFANLPSETWWWLQVQPSYVFLKGLPCEQLNASEVQLETLQCGMERSWKSKSDEVAPVKKDDLTDADGSNTLKDLIQLSSDHFSTGMSNNSQQSARNLSSDGLSGMNKSDIISSYEFVELDSFGSSASKKSNDLVFEADCPWIEIGKKPWWRATDKDDLASLVAKKSLVHVENCDLPPPQKMHVSRHPYSRLGRLEPQNVLEPSIGWIYQPHATLNSTTKEKGSPDDEQNFGMKRGSADEGHFTYGPDNSSSKTSYGTVDEDMKTASCGNGEQDPGKAQLLEALCHSQTRAREAEKAAKRANAEKEHIIRLVFKQASQLFAYKQWFQLLQLECMYLQVKHKDEDPSFSTFFPEFRSRMASKGKKLRRNSQRDAIRKRRKAWELRVDVTKYAVAFALGLGLVGAGLLLGWTVGRMLPPF